MNRVVLAEVKIPLETLYLDGAKEAYDEQVRLARQSLPALWARKNNCEVKSTVVTDNMSGTCIFVLYAALSPEQLTEFALRF